MLESQTLAADSWLANFTRGPVFCMAFVRRERGKGEDTLKKEEEERLHTPAFKMSTTLQTPAFSSVNWPRAVVGWFCSVIGVVS